MDMIERNCIFLMKPSEFNIVNGERINNNKIVKLSIIAKPGRGIFRPSLASSGGGIYNK